MFVLEFYRRHQGLMAFSLFENRERARTAMIAWAHDANSKKSPDGSPWWAEGKGSVQHQDADTVRIMVDRKPDGHGYYFDWYNEFRVREIQPESARWPTYEHESRPGKLFCD